jgi:hypothetical protein
MSAVTPWIASVAWSPEATPIAFCRLDIERDWTQGAL